jgi:hypothetical protein
MGDLNGIANNKKQDTLFGPNIGVIASGPAWTEANEKKSSEDQLTPEIVKGWITKSKEVNKLSGVVGLNSNSAVGISTDHYLASTGQP